MKGHCPNEEDKILNGAEYFLLNYITTIDGLKLKPGTIILKKQNLFYFFSPDDEDIYRIYTSVSGKTSTILTKDEEKNLLSNCFIVNDTIRINNTIHTIKCILIDNVDPDGIPDFTGFLECEDDEGNSKKIMIKDLFNQAGGRHFRGARHSRSRKRTYKRKTKSRRKKRAF